MTLQNHHKNITKQSQIEQTWQRQDKSQHVDSNALVNTGLLYREWLGQ